MKTIHVVAAIIIHDHKLFVTQRGYGEFKDGWEFPGGKIEPGESPQEALKREILEELATEIEVGSHIDTIEYAYEERKEGDQPHQRASDDSDCSGNDLHFPEHSFLYHGLLWIGFRFH